MNCFPLNNILSQTNPVLLSEQQGWILSLMEFACLSLDPAHNREQMSLQVLDVFKARPRHSQLPSLADNFSSHAE